MKRFLFLLFILNHNIGLSQQKINIDNNDIRINYSPSDILHGHSMGSAEYVSVTSGSAYFSEHWMNSNIYINDSAVAGNVRVKLNLLDGSFLYLDKKNDELISNQPVLKIAMTDTLTNTKYVFIQFPGTAKDAGKNWYQVLAGKEFTLLKKYNKKIVESKAYASSITDQDIHTTESYFIGHNNKITIVKKFPDIIALAGSKGSKLEEYINNNHLSVKKEADLISLINYYSVLD